MKRLSSRYLWLSVIALLYGALMRIYHLNLQGLWGDEGFSVEFTTPVDPAAITQNLVPDLHPPLYFILLGLWREIAGSSVISMRMLAVYSALITIALIIRLGKKFFDPSTAVIAGIILAQADKHIVLSQEVRQYPMAFMWTAGTSLAFFNWLEKPTRTRTLVYSILIMASLYTHYYTALAILIQGIYALIFLRPWSRVGKFIGIAGLSGLAFLPWLPVVWYQLHIRPEGILHSYSRSMETLEHFSLEFLGSPVPLFVGLLILGITAIRLQDQFSVSIRHQPYLWYVVLWFAIPIFLAVALFDYVMLLTDRNMAMVILPIALLVAHGITSFRPPAQILLVTIIVFNAAVSLDAYQDHPPWREMGEFVAENYPEGEPILTDIFGGEKALRYHIEQEIDSDVEVISLNNWRAEFGDQFLGRLERFLLDNNGFWLAYWGDGQYEFDTFFERYGYSQTAKHAEYHLGFAIYWYHYDKLPPLDQTLAVFDERIKLHQIKAPGGGDAGESMNVSLWWSTSETLSTPYSISVFLLDNNGVLRAQHDGPPQNGAQPFPTWDVDTIILDAHQIPLPADLPAGEYRLAVKVYNSADNTILVPSGENVINDEYVIVGTVSVR